MRRLVYAGVFGLIAVSSFCPTLTQAASIIGPIGTCGKWMQERKVSRNGTMQLYVLGYVSGASTWGDPSGILDGLDADAIYFYIDNYCRPRPLESFLKGVGAFIRERQATLKE